MFVTVSALLAAVCLLTAASQILGHPKMRQSAAHFGSGRSERTSQRSGCGIVTPVRVTRCR